MISNINISPVKKVFTVLERNINPSFLPPLIPKENVRLMRVSIRITGSWRKLLKIVLTFA